MKHTNPKIGVAEVGRPKRGPRFKLEDKRKTQRDLSTLQRPS